MTTRAATKGLERLQQVYLARDKRARELMYEGEKIIGYLCAFTPLELLTAAGLVPFRFLGNMRQPITEADIHMETIVCPFVRSCFDVAIKRGYDFCDGLVIPHTCDSISRTYPIWKNELGFSLCHYLDVPHLVDQSSKEFFKSVLGDFRYRLEQYIGRPITTEQIRQAVALHNGLREKIRELYQLRQQEPPPISGSEMTEVIVATMSLPVWESIELLKNAIKEVKARKVTTAKKLPRLLLYGSEVNDTIIMELIEQSGANIVMDDQCVGSRFYWNDVSITPDPMDGLVERYLEGIPCPRTFKPRNGTYQEYLEERFGYLGQFVRDFAVDGVILYVYKYCDPLGFDVPDLKYYLESKGYPVLYMEDVYSVPNQGKLRTTFQAFVEMLGGDASR